jgi:hypothetical protein
VWVISAVFKSLNFISDQGVLTTNDYDWTDCNVTFSPPDWVAGTTTNNPISQTMNTPVELAMTVNVQPAKVPYTLTGAGGLTFLSLGQSNITASGSDQELIMKSSNSLPNYVGINSIPITWTISAFSNAFKFSTNSGPHTIYTTYGTPVGSSPATQKRMSYICTLTRGQNTPASIVTAIGPVTMGGSLFEINNNANDMPYTTAWELLG